jgi:hypothetical protein
MAMADEIRDLATRSLTALNAGHDYYAHTKTVWRLMQQAVKAGRTFVVRNMATGTVVNEEALLGLAQQYITEYQASFSFQHFVSLLEDWLFDLLRLWLLGYPNSLAKRAIEFSVVLDAADKAAITLAVVDKELNELKYRKVAEWFAYLEKLVRLGVPNADQIEHLAEIKASRDILAHNQGVANKVYVAKAGVRARYPLGAQLEIPEHYLRESWETIRQVIRDVSAAAEMKC